MSKPRVSILFATLVMGVLLSGCATRHRVVVYAPTAPPAAVTESITVSPGPGYFWIPGHHVWESNTYVWAPGRWDLRPAGRREWVPGHWARNRHGWFWIEGHWR